MSIDIARIFDPEFETLYNWRGMDINVEQILELIAKAKATKLAQIDQEFLNWYDAMLVAPPHPPLGEGFRGPPVYDEYGPAFADKDDEAVPYVTEHKTNFVKKRVEKQRKKVEIAFTKIEEQVRELKPSDQVAEAMAIDAGVGWLRGQTRALQGVEGYLMDTRPYCKPTIWRRLRRSIGHRIRVICDYLEY